MLGTKNAMATVAVRDLAKARAFYEDKLGLVVNATMGGEAVSYEAGTTTLLVYRSNFAGTNQATTVTWMVGADLEPMVRELRTRGIVFEHYDMEGMKRDGDIHHAGGTKAAWFKDPDGNIHNLASG